MLKEVVRSGTARKANLGYAPQGGKTGTNQSYRDAWFIGFTAHNVTGVWVGNDDFTPMEKVTGGLIPAPAWKRIMDVAEEGLAPMAVAGIPLDDTYTAVAAAQPKMNLQPVSDETGVAPVDPATPGVNADGVAVVLNDMFSLFEKEKTPKRVAKQRRPKSADEPLILPNANADSQSGSKFFDGLFGSSDAPRKKRKKFTIFGF
jgi:penicillin-binding protein 1A